MENTNDKELVDDSYESTTENEADNDPRSDSSEASGSGQQELEQARAEAAKFKAIAQRERTRREKVQALLDDEEESSTKDPEPTQNPGQPREEAILYAKLYAKGYDDDDVALLQKLSKVSGVSPLEAQEDDMFKYHMQKKRDAERSAKAQLGASSGSASYSKVQDEYKSILEVGEQKSRESHQKAYEEYLSNIRKSR